MKYLTLGVFTGILCCLSILITASSLMAAFALPIKLDLFMVLAAVCTCTQAASYLSALLLYWHLMNNLKITNESKE